MRTFSYGLRPKDFIVTQKTARIKYAMVSVFPRQLAQTVECRARYYLICVKSKAIQRQCHICPLAKLTHICHDTPAARSFIKELGHTKR
jgi:hypothetical protein